MKTILKYLFSSGSSFIVDILIFSIINYFTKEIILSSYIARFISSIYNYLLNKLFVFNNKKRSLKSLIYYFLLVIINITISSLLVNNIYNSIHYNPTLIKVIIDTIIFIVNYYLQKYIIFKK